MADKKPLAGGTKFPFEEAKEFMEFGECARRQHWSHDDVICCRNTVFFNLMTDKPVELTDEDRAADDWIVYREG